MLLMLPMPRNPLLERRLGRHLVLFVPELVHGERNPRNAPYRAIRNITQLSTTAEPQNSTKQ